MKVGILALQGAFAVHEEMLQSLGADTVQVRTPQDLGLVDALVMPGGESTTMSHLLNTSQLFDPIAERIDSAMPVFGTCAGMILLAKSIGSGRPDQRFYGAIDIDVERNAYGRQVESFETELNVRGLQSPFHAMFIRAPQVVRLGADVEVLSTHEDKVVLARQCSVMVASFHPELTSDNRIHSLFLQEV
jgi:5'-phosphate synthase pdxT subunit